MLLPLLLLGLTSSVANADIVVSVSDVKPLPLKTASTASTALQLFQQSCPEEIQPVGSGPQAKVIVSSYADSPHDLAIANGKLYASSDSLVRGAIDAWAQHQSLVLRPDVVWFEILAQLNLYMTKHAEELRHLFVNFQGQEEIVVREWTWQGVIDGFKSEIQKRVKTHWLENWITPGFSTSNANDNTTATVLMMGLMQQYFKFTGGIICGLPSVTLLGERDDWAALLDKLENLRLFGAEPSQYAKNLRPILNMFVKTWDEPQSKQVQAFWKQIVRADKVFTCGTGPIEYDISGWITGFMHWSSNGDLPVGYAKAPLKLLDYPTPGTSSMAYVLAGNIGIARAEVASKAGSRSRGGVLAQPLSAWFLYGPVDVNATQTQSDVGSRSEIDGIYKGLRTNCPRGGY
ncbi:hypothetical protein HRG_008309 [Hirsutella rhossiliensis]|uniref:Uncharacterized protein n=1 Tax=Hirsutella rhossiliensis TaxID=111463 RepID=A0A9P8SFV4_9HYPO|nr:uncharacterized protein HRG_08309 [Hirsutella rhossiliensis]KAH0961156.1 hypothetical protein HRG_08309 [Hirsutella rhossiliensis]